MQKAPTRRHMHWFNQLYYMTTLMKVVFIKKDAFIREIETERQRQSERETQRETEREY